MKFKSLFLLLLLIVCTISCTTKSSQGDDIPEINIKSEPLLKNSDLFMKFPNKISIKDSSMCVWDLQGGDKFFHLYSFPDLKFITSFGTNGRGAGELICAGGFRMDDKNIYTFDNHRALLYIYALDSLRCQNHTPAQIINYPAECTPILGFTKTSNGFILLNYNGEKRITIVDSIGNLIEKKYRIPIPEDAFIRKYPEFIPSLWDSEIDYNPKNGVLGIVTKLGEVLEIYDLKKETSNIIVGKGNFPDVLKQGKSFSIGKMDGYSDIQVKGNSIYTVFSGADYQELHKKWAKGITTPDGGNYIYVYNLEGKLIKKYKLDQYINGLDVHEEEGVIYTVSSSHENSISKFRI